MNNSENISGENENSCSSNETSALLSKDNTGGYLEIGADVNNTTRHQNDHHLKDRNTMEYQRTRENTELPRQQVFANFVFNFLILFFVIYVIVKSFENGTVLFSWHPTLMTIGFFALMSQAILSFSDVNYLTYRINYKTLVFIHWVLQVISVITILLGFLAIYINKNRKNYPHIQSTHAAVGVTALVFTIVSTFGGIFTKYSFNLRAYIKPVYSKIGHAIFGSSTYILATVAIYMGLGTDWFVSNTYEHTRFILRTILISATIHVMIRPIRLVASRIHGLWLGGNA